MIKKHTAGLKCVGMFSVGGVNARNVFDNHGKQLYGKQLSNFKLQL